MKVKKGDFVELDFVGKIKESNTIFDLTLEEEAKKNNLYNPKQTYKPVIICIGENEIIKGLDEELMGKEVKKNYTIDIPQEKAFGKKNPKLIKLIPSKAFKQQRIAPFPGLQVNIDGIMGVVRAVSGGRIIIDFNHPLAGKNLIYDLTINKIVEDDKEKIQAILRTDKAKIEIKNNEAKITLDIPDKLKEILEKRIKKLVPKVKKLTFLKNSIKE